jgi:hypothetical protein
MKNRITRLLIVISIFYACKPPAREADPLPGLLESGIFVVNEGNFQSGNGGVSFYDSINNTVTQDIFYLKNNKPAGDVCQYLTYYQNQFYLVVNNSNKIEVLNNDFVGTKTITGFTSPRYIAFAANTKGYVTDLYAKGVSVLNTSTQNIEKKISINYWTEELLNYKDTIYVTSPESRYLYLIDGKSELLKDSIDIGFGSSSIALDNNNYLWILCSGKQSLSILPSLVCINPQTREIVRTINAASYSIFPSKLIFNRTNNCMYWIENDICKIDTDNAASTKEVIIPASGKTFYGLGIKSSNGDIVVSDAGDFSQRSTIYIYTKNGLERNSFKAGLISGNFLIR